MPRSLSRKLPIFLLFFCRWIGKFMFDFIRPYCGLWCVTFLCSLNNKSLLSLLGPGLLSGTVILFFLGLFIYPSLSLIYYHSLFIILYTMTFFLLVPFFEYLLISEFSLGCIQILSL